MLSDIARLGRTKVHSDAWIGKIFNTGKWGGMHAKKQGTCMLQSNNWRRPSRFVNEWDASAENPDLDLVIDCIMLTICYFCRLLGEKLVGFSCTDIIVGTLCDSPPGANQHLWRECWCMTDLCNGHIPPPTTKGPTTTSTTKPTAATTEGMSVNCSNFI